VFVPVDEGNNIRHFDLVSSLEKTRNSLRMTRVVMCRARLEALSPAKPGPKSPSQARPEGGLERALGRACKNRKPKPEA
jgi:hypothetical protein